MHSWPENEKHPPTASSFDVCLYALLLSFFLLLFVDILISLHPEAQPAVTSACACVCARFQDDDVKVTVGQPDPESAGTPPVASFVEGRLNCAAAVAIMDMKVRCGIHDRGCQSCGSRWCIIKTSLFASDYMTAVYPWEPTK